MTSSLYRTESSLKRTVPFQLREEPKRRLHPSRLGMHVSNEQGKPFTGPLCTKRLSNAYPRAMSATGTSKKKHKKEPMILHPVLVRAWQFLAIDLFEF